MLGFISFIIILGFWSCNKIYSIKDPDPVIFLEHRWLYDLSDYAPIKKYDLKLGKCNIIKKGKDLTIVSMSNSTHEIIGMKKFFQDNKISAEIIDLLSISPIDMKTIIKSVKKTGKFSHCCRYFRTNILLFIIHISNICARNE